MIIGIIFRLACHWEYIQRWHRRLYYYYNWLKLNVDYITLKIA